MTLGFALGMLIYSSSICIVGAVAILYFYNKSKKEQERKKEELKNRPHGWFGDDTVWKRKT